MDGQGGKKLIVIILLLLGLGAVLYFTGKDYKANQEPLEKQEEAERQENTPESRQFSEYLNQELVPKYGYTDLDKRIREVSMEEALQVQVTTDAYERFLKGEEAAYVRKENIGVGENVLIASERIQWTLQDILVEIQEYFGGRYRELTPQIEYAYMDCGEDGYEEMLLKIKGLDIYSPGDDSDLTLIITGKNGRLEIIYAYETWARSYTEADYYGCITGGGSAGAGDYVFDMEYVDENGDIHTVYTGDRLGGWWMSGISGRAYNEAFPPSANQPGMSITIYKIMGKTYYSIDDASNLSQAEQKFISLCEAEGTEFISAEEIDVLISDRKKELGIKEEWNTGKGVCWNAWRYEY